MKIMYKVRSEWLIRELERPPTLVTKKSMVMWLATALGLKNPGDGRDGVVYLLDALFYYCFRDKIPSLDDLTSYVNRRLMEIGKKPLTEEALRHHLRRMMKMGMVEREKGKYCFSRDPFKPDDPAGFITVVFRRMETARKLISSVVMDLKSLYQ